MKKRKGSLRPFLFFPDIPACPREMSLAVRVDQGPVE